MRAHLLVSVIAALLAFIGGAPASAQAPGEPVEEAGAEKDPVTMSIMDDDAVLLITKVEGRDVVRVVGRTRVDHRRRSIWTNELVYDEEAGHAAMTGDVELVDHGDDGLNLTSDYLELNLNTEAAVAKGDVRFTRQDAAGTADELYYGELAHVHAVIEAEMTARPESVRRMVNETLGSFLADDEVLVLRGRVEMKDGDREFQSEFVIINTRDDAMVSLGRSAAKLPAPEEDID